MSVKSILSKAECEKRELRLAQEKKAFVHRNATLCEKNYFAGGRVRRKAMTCQRCCSGKELQGGMPL